MKDVFQGPALRSSGFARAPSPEGFGPLWRSYWFEGEPCRGWFHFLSPEEALWSISIHDFIMDGDYVMNSRLPNYLSHPCIACHIAIHVARVILLVLRTII